MSNRRLRYGVKSWHCLGVKVFVLMMICPFELIHSVLTGCQDKCEVVLSCIENLPSPFRQMTGTLIEVCAYAGSGNVLKVRAMQLCNKIFVPISTVYNCARVGGTYSLPILECILVTRDDLALCYLVYRISVLKTFL